MRIVGIDAGTTGGIATTLWIAALWYAAPVLQRHVRALGLASRVRDTLTLGVAIPSVLGCIGLLHGWSCVALAVLAAIARTWLAPPSLAGLRSRSVRVSWRALPILAILANAWPNMVRPLLDGDSLSYHLPNAAAWVHAHNLWITSTRYWWYPGGSELFASGIFAVAGPYGLPVCGVFASLLLALRVYDFAEMSELRPIAAGVVSAAIVAVHAVALQAANLENDVWLSAFLIEMLWCSRYEKEAFLRTAAVASLIKPAGFVFAIVLQVIARVPLRRIAIASLAIVAWFARDAVLWHGATVPASKSAYPQIWTTTIAWHAFSGIDTFVRAAAGDGPLFVVACIATIATIVFRRDRSIRLVAFAFFVLFWIEPFGFLADGPQLANGQSLRFALPALVFGCIGSLAFVRRNERFVVPVLALATAFELFRFQQIFVSDGSVRSITAVLILAAVALFVPFPYARRVASGGLALALVAYAGRIAAIHPSGYYDDQLTSGVTRSALSQWIATNAPPSVVARYVPIGEIEIVSPHTVALDGVDDGACALARERHAIVVAAAVPGVSDETFATVRTNLRACGDVRYEDGRALVVKPH